MPDSGTSADTVAPVDLSQLDCPVTEDAAWQALERGVAVLEQIPAARVDSLWVLQQVAEKHPDLGIDTDLGSRPVSEPSDPARQLLDPEVPPGRIAADRSTANGRLLYDFSAVFDTPSPESLAVIDTFTAAPDLTGYALTHQWLTLIWARQLGLELSEAVWQREGQLEQAVGAEVGAAAETQDLWAERVGLLGMFGTAAISEADRAAWICRAVQTQQPDGTWLSDGTYQQVYEGEQIPVTADGEHTTATTVLALAGLLPPREPGV